MRSEKAGRLERSKAAGPAPLPPAAWLEKIEAMLWSGKDAQLLEEWRTFRQAYPDYPVPQTTVEQIEALRK
jgi:hypothetical protein